MKKKTIPNLNFARRILKINQSINFNINKDFEILYTQKNIFLILY